MLKGNYLKCWQVLDESIKCIEHWKDLFFRTVKLIDSANFHDENSQGERNRWGFENNQIFA